LSENEERTATEFVQVEKTRPTYTVWEEQTHTEPVYETSTYTVQKRGQYYPDPTEASNIQAHTTTEYKVEKVVGTKPVWQDYEKKHRYKEYKYKWVYNG